MLLSELLGYEKSLLASSFLYRLLQALEEFPILLLFESRTRIELLFLLQCVRKTLPDCITDHPSLILLMNELWLWFEMNRNHLHTQPFYSLIDGLIRSFFSFVEKDPLERDSLPLIHMNPLYHLRYDYYMYQRSLYMQKTPMTLSQCHHSFIHFMNTMAPSMPLTRMVKNNQSVILVDNSPVCSTENGVGVMLPFYGSSSFLTEQFLKDNGQSAGVSAIEHVWDCILKEKENVIEVLNEIAENGKWIVYLKWV